MVGRASLIGELSRIHLRLTSYRQPVSRAIRAPATSSQILASYEAFRGKPARRHKAKLKSLRAKIRSFPIDLSS